MVSQMMLEDAEDLAKRGIVLTPREVVRLNAYGLRAERGTVASALFTVRRACICGDLTFHEPTIGHHLWLAEAERVLDLDDNETSFYTRAYWLATRDSVSLPSVSLPRVLGLAVRAWASKHLRDKTLRELSACMDYVERGADSTAHERGPNREDSSEDDDWLPAEDWCSEIGVVRDGQALGLGIPLADALRMTHAELRAVVDRAHQRICGDSKTAKADAVGDYQVVLAEIVKAHEGSTDGR